MDVLVAILLCVIIFLLYLLNENKNEVLKLKREQRNRENYTIDTSPQIQSPPLLKPPVDRKTFVSVIFKEHDQKYYDYLLGDNYDVRVNDFVVVPVHDKITGKNMWKVARVKYISSPGEISLKARSAILKKADYNKW